MFCPDLILLGQTRHYNPCETKGRKQVDGHQTFPHTFSKYAKKNLQILISFQILNFIRSNLWPGQI